MYCEKCGSNIEKGERFCYRCGAAVAAGGYAGKEIKKQKKRWPLAVLIALVVLAAAVTGVVLFTQGEVARKVKEQLALADRYLDELDYDRAIAAYKAVLELDEKNADAYLGLAEAYAATGRADKAEDILTEGLALTDDREIEKELKILRKEERGEKEDTVTTPTEKLTPTEKPTLAEEPEEDILVKEVWRQAYLTKLEEIRTEWWGIEDAHMDVWIISLDDDGIPDLYVEPWLDDRQMEAAGGANGHDAHYIVTYQNGSAYHESWFGSGGEAFFYLRGSGILVDCYPPYDDGNGHTQLNMLRCLKAGPRGFAEYEGYVEPEAAVRLPEDGEPMTYEETVAWLNGKEQR